MSRLDMPLAVVLAKAEPGTCSAGLPPATAIAAHREAVRARRSSAPPHHAASDRCGKALVAGILCIILTMPRLCKLLCGFPIVFERRAIARTGQI